MDHYCIIMINEDEDGWEVHGETQIIHLVAQPANQLDPKPILH